MCCPFFFILVVFSEVDEAGIINPILKVSRLTPKRSHGLSEVSRGRILSPVIHWATSHISYSVTVPHSQHDKNFTSFFI